MIYKGFLFALVGAAALASGQSAELTTGGGGGGVYSQPAPDTTDKEPHYSQPVRSAYRDLSEEFILISAFPPRFMQLIENPSYDPSLYTSFVPQDAVQQYVSHYGGPYGAPPSYFGQSPDSSFAVQTGYEGYLVPSLAPYGAAPSHGNALSSFAKMAPVGFGFLKSLFPVAGKVFLAVIAKLAIVAMSTFGVVVAGGLVTSLLCAFTPVCKLSFAGFPFLKLKDTAKQLTSTLETELTQERVKRAAELVRLALQKYNELQTEFSTPEKEVPQAAEPVSVADAKDE